MNNSNNKTGLVVALSILSTCLIVVLVLLVLFLTGVISTSPKDDTAAATQQTSTTTAEQAPAQAQAQEQEQAPTQAQMPTQTTPPAISGNTTVSEYRYVANVKYSIYLRSAPTENDGNIICEIPLGTQIGYIEATNGVFSKINYNGTIGYSKTEYLSRTKPNLSTPSNILTVCNVKVSIYLRSAPVENGNNIICEIPVGTQVELIERTNSTFYKIRYNGYVGYSKAEYLR